MSLFFHRQKGLRNSVEFGYALVGLEMDFFFLYQTSSEAGLSGYLFFWYRKKHAYIHTRSCMIAMDDKMILLPPFFSQIFHLFLLHENCLYYITCIELELRKTPPAPGHASGMVYLVHGPSNRSDLGDIMNPARLFTLSLGHRAKF